MKRVRHIFNIIVLLFISVWLILSGCAKKYPVGKGTPVPTASVTSPTPSPTPTKIGLGEGEIEFKGSTLQSREGARRNWVINTKNITYDERKGTAEAGVVEATFYGANNKPALSFVAKGVKVYIKTGSMNFEGAVNAKSAAGEELYVKKLRWDGKRKKLIGEEFVQITRKHSVTTAKRMVGDPSLKRVTLSGNVKILYNNEENFLRAD